ncbi:MAG: spore maturation protein CgeB, partial [Glaciecola sp.]
ATREYGTQHLGVRLRPSVGCVPSAVNVGEGSDAVPTAEVRGVPAVTAACLAVRRVDFDRVGGLDDRYAWGSEDVDLCWRLREHGRLVVAGAAVLFHHEGATRHRTDPAVLRERQAGNRRHLEARFGPDLAREVLLDSLAGRTVVADRPLHVGITVTRDLASAGYGDWMTAHELGEALQASGLRVSYLERYRDAWYDLPASSSGDALDVVVVLIDLFDLRRLPDPPPLTVAWVRNHPDRWVSHAWFDDFDLVLASSRLLVTEIVKRSRHRTVQLFPLATNPARFWPVSEDRTPDPSTDGATSNGGPISAGGAAQAREGIVFTGNHWGREDRLSEVAAVLPDLVVHGKGWQDVPAIAPLDRGALAYDDLPALYRRSLLVLDQAAGPTAGSGSVNSRVFDALAAGALPVTSQVQGAAELFGDDLPTWSSPQELATIVADLRANPDDVADRVERLRTRVLAEHTYTARADRLRGLLRTRVEARSFVLATSCPDRSVASSWGDWHLAWAMADELRTLGHRVDVITQDQWSSSRARAADVFVHLRGRSVPAPAQGQTHVIWNISHPEELTPQECEAADLVLVGSEKFAEHLRALVSTPVGVLAQATDERRFSPRAPDPAFDRPVGFLGNSRFVMRPVVQAALDAKLDLTIWGANWDRYVDPAMVAARHVDNVDVPRLYSSVGVLLNDHWDGMRRWGYVSNRLFDALACGAVVVSDEVPGMDELFDNAVATWSTADDLAQTVARLLADPQERERRSAQGRAAVLARHTFAHRAQELLALLTDLEVRAVAGG